MGFVDAADKISFGFVKIKGGMWGVCWLLVCRGYPGVCGDVGQLR